MTPATPTPSPAMSRADELKPCPFCGSSNLDDVFWMNGSREAGPGCNNCGATAESIPEWNRRIHTLTPAQRQILKIADEAFEFLEETATNKYDEKQWVENRAALLAAFPPEPKEVEK